MTFVRVVPMAVMFLGLCKSRIIELGGQLCAITEWGWRPAVILLTPGLSTWVSAHLLQWCGFEFLAYLAPNAAADEIAKYVTGWWWLVCGVALCVLVAHDALLRAPFPPEGAGSRKLGR